MPSARIAGTGSYLPEKRVTNRELARRLYVNRKGESFSISEEEIFAKTGIQERRYAVQQTTSDLACEAGRQAIISAGLHPDDIDLLLLATNTPDYLLPAVAPLAAAKIGLTGVSAYDFGRGGTGFVEALQAAACYVMSGQSSHVLVIGADRLSGWINPRSKAASILFGDGAGAVVVSASEAPNRGYLTSVAGSQGENFRDLYIPAGGTAIPFSPDLPEGQDKIVMDGRAMSGWASQTFAVGVEQVLAKAQLAAESLDLLVPSQAHARIIEAGAKVIDLPMGKVALSVEFTGDTGAASVPLALDIAASKGRLRAGHLICFLGNGAGLSWIASLWRW